MKDLICPSCSSPNVEQIDTDRYQCPYCGEIFSSYQGTTAKNALAQKASSAETIKADEPEESIGFFKQTNFFVWVLSIFTFLFSCLSCLGAMVGGDPMGTKLSLATVGLLPIILLIYLYKLKKEAKKLMIITVIVLFVLAALGNGIMGIQQAFAVFQLLLIGLLAASMRIKRKGKSVWQILS